MKLAEHHAEAKLNGKQMDATDGEITGKSLRNYCNTLVEEYEEDLKERMFSTGKGKKTWSRWLCVEETSVCTEDEYLEIWAEAEDGIIDEL